VKGSNGGFWHWIVSGLAIISVAASPNFHSVDLASFQPLRKGQIFKAGFLALLVPYLQYLPAIPSPTTHPM